MILVELRCKKKLNRRRDICIGVSMCLDSGHIIFLFNFKKYIYHHKHEVNR